MMRAVWGWRKPFVLWLLGVVVTFWKHAEAARPDKAQLIEEWKKRVVYNVMTDRLARPDGSSHPCDNWYSYCGGGWRGIINKLDHLAELGVDALLMSPVTENMPDGYHGYWPSNFTRINPRFGTARDLKELVYSVHARGWLIAVDVVTNHAGHFYNTTQITNDVFPFNKEEYYHQCYDYCAECNVNMSSQSRPNYWNCRLSGLPDLDQENPYVNETLLKVTQGIVDIFEFDGVRLDAATNTPIEWCRTITDYLSVPTFAEVVLDPKDYKPVVTGMQQTLKTVVLLEVFAKQQAIYKINETWTYSAAVHGTNDTDFTYMENPDHPRFLMYKRDAELYRNALLVIMTTLGIPHLFYGSELGFGYSWLDHHNATEKFSDVDFREPYWAYGEAVSGLTGNGIMFRSIQRIIRARKDTQLWTQDREKFLEIYLSAYDSVIAYRRGDQAVVVVGNGLEEKLSPTFSVVGVPWTAGTVVYNALYPEDPVKVTSDYVLDVPMHGNKDAKLYTTRNYFPPSKAWAQMTAFAASLLWTVAIFTYLLLRGAGIRIIHKSDTVSTPPSNDTTHVLRTLLKPHTHTSVSAAPARACACVGLYTCLWPLYALTRLSRHLYHRCCGSSSLVDTQQRRRRGSTSLADTRDRASSSLVDDHRQGLISGNGSAALNDKPTRQSSLRNPVVIEDDGPSFLPPVSVITHGSTRSLASQQQNGSTRSLEPAQDSPPRVLFATLEHSIKDFGIKVSAGGLGNVMAYVVENHPGHIGFVFPEMGGVSYTEGTREEPVYATIEGQRVCVDVHTYDYVRPDGGSVRYHMLRHDIFTRRKGTAEIYPEDLETVEAAYFYSLWNQCIGELVARGRYEVYHACDYHGALAFLYCHTPVNLVLTLHNAEYQGCWDCRDEKKKQRLLRIWDLIGEKSALDKFVVYNGGFNMLYGAVRYIRRYQRSRGICSVSGTYAAGVQEKYDVFWGGSILATPNPYPPPPHTFEELQEKRRHAKALVQQEYGLHVDQDAKIFVFLARWVMQKGIDLIADIAAWLVCHHDAQLICIGPTGDLYGRYAAEKLQVVSKFYPRLVYVKAEFVQVKPELKLAADFVLVPSRDEPFGYTDVEFAYMGAIPVGALVGGLGKVSGVYYRPSGYTGSYLLRQLQDACVRAMQLNPSEIERLQREALTCTFPLDEWKHTLMRVYEIVRASSTATDDVLALSTRGGSADGEGGREVEMVPVQIEDDEDDVKEEATEAHEPAIHTVTSERLGSTASAEPLHRSLLDFTQQEVVIETEKRIAPLTRDVDDASPKCMVDYLQRRAGVAEALILQKAPHSKVARMLFRRFWGVRLFNLVVAAPYVLSLASSFVVFVMSYYWAYELHWGSESIKRAFAVYVLTYSVASMVSAIAALKLSPRALVPLGVLANLIVLALPFVRNEQAVLGLVGCLAVGNGMSLPLCLGLNFLEDTHQNLLDVANRICCLEFLRTLLIAPVAPCLVYYGFSNDLLPYWLAYFVLLAILSVVVCALAIFSALPFIYNVPQLHRCHFPVVEILTRKSFLFLALGEFFSSCTWYPRSYTLLYWVLVGATRLDLTYETIAIVIGRLIVSSCLGYLLAGLARINPLGIVLLGVTLPPAGLYTAIAVWPAWRSLAVSSFIILFSFLTDAAKGSALGFVYITIFRRQHIVASTFLRAICWGLGVVTSLYIVPRILERFGLDMSFSPRADFNQVGEAIFWATMPFALLQYATQAFAAKYYLKENLAAPA